MKKIVKKIFEKKISKKTSKHFSKKNSKKNFRKKNETSFQKRINAIFALEISLLKLDVLAFFWNHPEASTGISRDSVPTKVGTRFQAPGETLDIPTYFEGPRTDIGGILGPRSPYFGRGPPRNQKNWEIFAAFEASGNCFRFWMVMRTWTPGNSKWHPSLGKGVGRGRDDEERFSLTINMTLIWFFHYNNYFTYLSLLMRFIPSPLLLVSVGFIFLWLAVRRN